MNVLQCNLTCVRPIDFQKRKERLARARGHSSNGFNNTRIPKPAARGRPATPQRVRTKRAAMDHSVDEAPAAPRPQTPLGRRRQAAIESMLASGSKGGVTTGPSSAALLWGERIEILLKKYVLCETRVHIHACVYVLYCQLLTANTCKLSHCMHMFHSCHF